MHQEHVTIDRGNIGDLLGDTKRFSESSRQKELREQMLLTRDAVHGELLKSIRAIDVMRGCVLDALKHSPPRTQAESDRAARQAAHMAQRRLAGAGVSSRSPVASDLQPSKSPSPDASSSLSPPPANRGVHSPRTASYSPYFRSSANAKLSPSGQHQLRTPKSLGGAGVGLFSAPTSASAAKNKSKSPSVPTLSSPSSISGYINNNNNGHPLLNISAMTTATTVADRSMKTDSQLPFEGIAVCRMQLEESLSILRGRPHSLGGGGGRVDNNQDASFVSAAAGGNIVRVRPTPSVVPAFAAAAAAASASGSGSGSGSRGTSPKQTSISAVLPVSGVAREQPALLHRRIEHVNVGESEKSTTVN